MIAFALVLALVPETLHVRPEVVAIGATTSVSFAERLLGLGDLRGASVEFTREVRGVDAARCLLLCGDTAGALGLLRGDTSAEAGLARARIYASSWRMTEAFGALPDSPDADSLLVWLRVMTMDFEGARESASGDSSLLATIDRAERTAPLLYSPVSAARLSCLPGLGHFYIDEPARGAWALTLNLGIMAGIGYSIAEAIRLDQRSYYIDAFLIWQFFLNRFYTGASAQAVRIAETKNKRLLDDWLANLARDTGFDPVHRW